MEKFSIHSHQFKTVYQDFFSMSRKDGYDIFCFRRWFWSCFFKINFAVPGELLDSYWYQQQPNSGTLILEPAPGSTATPVVTTWAPGTINKSRAVVCKHYISSNEFLSSFCMLENVNFLSGSTTFW